MAGGKGYVGVHALPAAIAAIIPSLAFGGAGLAILPALYLFAIPFRQYFYVNFWAMPILASLVFALQNPEVLQSDIGAFSTSWPMFEKYLSVLIPITVSIVAHYTAVAVAVSCRKKFGRDIDEICTSISDYLVVKCFEQRTLPSFLYMKSERVLIAVSCTLKIILAVAYLIFFFLFNTLPSDIIGCASKSSSPQPPSGHTWLWAMYLFIYITDVTSHVSLFLSGTLHNTVTQSFSHLVVCPSYWQWYFIAAYSPSANTLWIPFTVECVRSISVSFFRMQDKEDALVNPLMSCIDLIHGVSLLALTALLGCPGYPTVMLHLQLAHGYLFVAGYVGAILKHRRLLKTANTPIRCRIYLPYRHEAIECHERQWQKNAEFPRTSKDGRVIRVKDFGHCKLASKCRAVLHPELSVERYEMKPHWGDDANFSYQRHARKTPIPGQWICVDIPLECGVLLSESAVDTGLKGQFRVLHALRDPNHVIDFWGDFQAKLYAAKRYKKDPAGGWDLEDPGTLETDAERYAAVNRHMRLVKPYFQDCLMQEKAAEFGRAFNASENLPVRKVELLRACVLEVDWETDMPQLYLLEPFLDDNTPFRKFNNNDFVPGHKATQNTPNLFSLFTYFHSQCTLLVCDIQGKKYKFTDPQFHTNKRVAEEEEDFDLDDEEEEGPDWLHSDGGFEMMRRVLYGLHRQRALHALCNRAWPKPMQALSEQVKEWEADGDFMTSLRELEKQAGLYSDYFSNLDPVLDAAAAGLQVDAEDEHDKAMSKMTRRPSLGTRVT